jgi:methylphosphotriester-DNA--protein-cysteine methyltransferase
MDKRKDPLHKTPLQAKADEFARRAKGGNLHYYIGRYEGWLAGYRAAKRGK